MKNGQIQKQIIINKIQNIEKNLDNIEQKLIRLQEEKENQLNKKAKLERVLEDFGKPKNPRTVQNDFDSQTVSQDFQYQERNF